MSSTLHVNNLVEKTSGNGVHIPGHVIQTKLYKSNTYLSSSNTSYSSTGYEINFTPKYANSILSITINGGMEGAAGGGATEVSSWKIFRGSTQVEASDSGKRIYLKNDTYVPLTTVFLDSPATTSNTTYTLHMKRFFGSGTVSWNRDGINTTTITLMEIAQ